MAMSGKLSMSAASAPGSSSGLSQTPTSFRVTRVSCSDFQSASGTITAVSRRTSANDVASLSSVQRSSTMARPLMSRGIDALLEGLQSQTADGVDEALVLMPFFHVDIDQAGNDIRHLLCRERWTYHLAQ